MWYYGFAIGVLTCSSVMPSIPGVIQARPLPSHVQVLKCVVQHWSSGRIVLQWVLGHVFEYIPTKRAGSEPKRGGRSEPFFRILTTEWCHYKSAGLILPRQHLILGKSTHTPLSWQVTLKSARSRQPCRDQSSVRPYLRRYDIRSDGCHASFCSSRHAEAL